MDECDSSARADGCQLVLQAIHVFQSGRQGVVLIALASHGFRHVLAHATGRPVEDDHCSKALRDRLEICKAIERSVESGETAGINNRVAPNHEGIREECITRGHR